MIVPLKTYRASCPRNSSQFASSSVNSKEQKGFVSHRKDGTKYVYRPTQSRSTASRSALSHLMKTFFENSVADTMAAAFELQSDKLTEEDLLRLESLISKARKEGR